MNDYKILICNLLFDKGILNTEDAEACYEAWHFYNGLFINSASAIVNMESAENVFENKHGNKLMPERIESAIKDNMFIITITDNGSKISAAFSGKSELSSICYRASEIIDLLFNRYMKLRTKDALEIIDSMKQIVEEA